MEVDTKPKTEMTLKDNIGPEWYEILEPLFDTDWMQLIMKRAASLGDKLRPEPHNVFNAYRSTPPSKVKVVIMGQDPYPRNEAHGLSFSSKQSNIPPSLRVIFKELELSGYGTRTNPNLQDWADQGVLLLNSILTTTYGVAGAHKDWQWQKFTGETLRYLSTLNQPMVFLGWGAYAQKLYVDQPGIWPGLGPKLVLSACHPQAENYNSARNRFTGCGHFVEANRFLQSHNLSPIKWV
jgi:uracil-DNA glycosylase